MKPFGIFVASNVVISVKLFTETKMSFVARMPNGFYFIRFYDFLEIVGEVGCNFEYNSNNNS